MHYTFVLLDCVKPSVGKWFKTLKRRKMDSLEYIILNDLFYLKQCVSFIYLQHMFYCLKLNLIPHLHHLLLRPHPQVQLHLEELGAY